MEKKKINSAKKGGSVPVRSDAEKQALKDRVICKKCGKDVEYTKAVEMHQNCPRCKAPLGRDLKEENKQAKRIINYDLLMRLKKYFLFFAFVLTTIAIAFNSILFFTQVFANRGWWIALMSLPLVGLSFLFMLSGALKLKSKSKKLRFFSWLVIILNIVAISAIVITAVPQLNDKLLEWYKV